MLELKALIKGEELETKDGWNKHIYYEGAREHVLSWDSNGVKCSHKNCVVNRNRKTVFGDEAIFL